jgi:Uma2 family endonuclease
MSVLSQIETEEIEYPSSDGEPMAESDITRFYMVYSVEALEIYFKDRPNVYVSANSFVYYERGNREAVVAPDVYVVLGVSQRKRDNYKVWQEGGIPPTFVLEITSETTQEKDQEVKPDIYRNLGVREYFQYDPSGDYLNPILQGVRLVEGNYEPISAHVIAFDTFWLWSEVLGLELQIVSGELRFRDPQTGEFLKTYRELDAALQQTEAALQQTEATLQNTEAALQQTEATLQNTEAALQQTAAALEEQQTARSQVESALKSLVRQLLNSGLEIDQVAQMTQLPAEEIEQLLTESGQ